MKNTKDGEQDATAVAHVSSGGPVQAIVGKGTIKMTCRVYGENRSAPESLWVKEVREKLRQLVRTTDTGNTSGAHPCGS